MTNVSIYVPNANIGAFNFNNCDYAQAPQPTPKDLRKSANLLLNILFSDAREYQMKYAISIPHGQGKTYSAMKFVKENENAIHVFCNESYTVDMIEGVVKSANPDNYPIFIFDDAHKLSDACLTAICKIEAAGLIVLGNLSLRTRIIEGIANGNKDYEVIYEAIGKRFVSM